MKNPILTATVKLLRAVRNADRDQLLEASERLAKFGDAWLITGSMDETLAGEYDSCLADTDLTEPIKEILQEKAKEAS